MIADLKPYLTTRDSGLPWFGWIPAHWEVRRNARIFAQRNETDFPELPILEVSLKTGVRIRNFENSNRKQIMNNREKYKRAAKNDIAYNMMRMWQGAVGVVPEDGLVSPAYVVARPFQETESRYYSYLFRTASYMNEVNKYSHGIVTDRNRLYWDEFKQMPSAFPSTWEQQKIADFLDYHKFIVSRFIHAKYRLIELLEEQKRAIIHRAVTRGLDPNVRLKSSGIEWLGDMPENWEVIALRYLGGKFGSGITPRGGASVYKPSGIPLLRSQNVHFSELRLGDVAFISPEMHKTMSGTHVKPGDVLINITGASIGRVCAVPDDLTDANVNQHVCIVRPKRRLIDSNFLASFLSTPFIQNEIYMSQNGASREGLSLRSLKALPVLVPPHSEQNQVIGKIKFETSHICQAILAATNEINLLGEYRTRLISDVVTGKLDVRGVTLPAAEDAEVPDQRNGTLELEADVIEDLELPELVQEEGEHT